VAKLAPTQVEQLQNIGAYLRQVRQEQGLSLDLLANQVFIRPALLHALETGNDDALPEPVFIQGFIRRYAEALGLDGQGISQEFAVTPVDVLPSPERLVNADTDGVVEPKTRHSIRVLEKAAPAPTTARRSTPKSKSSLPGWLGLGAVALLLIAGLWALFGRTDPSPVAGTPTDPATEANGVGMAEGEDDAASADTVVVESAPLEAPIVVTARLSERAWLSVVADGSNVYEGTPEIGFEETWTAEDTLVFTTGNAGGVELSVNGDDPVELGNSGDVRTLTLTPESGAETLATSP